MEIKEAQTKKDKLTDDIRKLIGKFQLETNCIVTEISIRQSYDMDAARDVPILSIEAKL